MGERKEDSIISSRDRNDSLGNVWLYEENNKKVSEGKRLHFKDLINNLCNISFIIYLNFSFMRWTIIQIEDRFWMNILITEGKEVSFILSKVSTNSFLLLIDLRSKNDK